MEPDAFDPLPRKLTKLWLLLYKDGWLITMAPTPPGTVETRQTWWKAGKARKTKRPLPYTQHLYISLCYVQVEKSHIIS